jgi:hypothetical protein
VAREGSTQSLPVVIPLGGFTPPCRTRPCVGGDGFRTERVRAGWGFAFASWGGWGEQIEIDLACFRGSAPKKATPPSAAIAAVGGRCTSSPPTSTDRGTPPPPLLSISSASPLFSDSESYQPHDPLQRGVQADRDSSASNPACYRSRSKN